MSLVSYMFIAACILQVEACNYNRQACQKQAQSGKCCPQFFTDCYNDDSGVDTASKLTCHQTETVVKACYDICGGDEGNEQKCEEYCKDFNASSECKPCELPEDGECDDEVTSATSSTVPTTSSSSQYPTLNNFSNSGSEYKPSAPSKGGDCDCATMLTIGGVVGLALGTFIIGIVVGILIHVYWRCSCCSQKGYNCGNADKTSGGTPYQDCQETVCCCYKRKRDSNTDLSAKYKNEGFAAMIDYFCRQ